jgi:pilus assembly protein FimV
MRIITSGALLALFLGASVANAAGLGKLTVNSGLGQILNAEIDLVSLQPGELDSLSARVATPEQFRDARIEYSSSLRLLRFAVDKRLNGQPYLKVTSVAPINEPFVDLLIDVTWPAGRIQREYPILLDPPGYTQGRVAPPTVAAAPPAASREPQTPPASAPAASSATPASAPAAPSAPSSAASGGPSASSELGSSGAPKETGASGDTYGPIQKGETLNKIAQEVKPANVSLEQMLVALYRENQGAFINNNMNRMKTGQILKVPSADDVAKIEQKDARAEIKTQVADWNSYREQVGGAVPQMPARETGTASAGRVSSAAVTPAPPPSAPPSDVLKLSKSDAGGKAGASGKGGAGSQDRVNALQEEVTAKDKALKESQSRVADLEKQIKDMQRLLDLRGAPTAAPGKADTKVATAPTPVPTPAKPEPAKVEPPKPEPPKVAETKVAEPPKAVPGTTPTTPPKTDTKVADATKPGEPSKAAEPPKTDAAKPAEPPKAADATKAPPKPAPKKAAPPPEKSFTDELMDNPWYLAAGLGVLGILGAGAFLFLRRRKDRAEAGPSSSMTSAFPSDLKPASTTGKAGGGLVDTGNSSFLTDFDKTGPGTIDTDEVDPVAEAEVYIAYGRDAQAEEILKEAMARDKNRHEIPLKLLEIYHARKSATAFETVAKELKATVGEDSPQWQKAAAMGAQIDPNNPLYAGASGGGTYTASAPHAKPDVDFDIAGQSAGGGAAPAPDFNLDADSSATSTGRLDAETTNSPSPAGMDFDIHGGAPATSHAEAPKHETPSSFDFDLSGLDSAKPAPAHGGTDLEVDPTQRSQPAGSSGLNLTDLSLDMPSDMGGGSSGGGGGGGGSEAVGTKLELAKAYLEIGDKDGAREILQEVAKEGSASQREEAEKLISGL